MNIPPIPRAAAHAPFAQVDGKHAPGGHVAWAGGLAGHLPPRALAGAAVVLPAPGGPAHGEQGAFGGRSVALVAVTASMASTRRALAAAEVRQCAERRMLAGAALVVAGAAMLGASEAAPARFAIGTCLVVGGAHLTITAAQSHRQANEHMQDVAQRLDYAAALLAFGQPD